MTTAPRWPRPLADPLRATQAAARNLADAADAIEDDCRRPDATHRQATADLAHTLADLASTLARTIRADRAHHRRTGQPPDPDRQAATLAAADDPAPNRTR